MAWNPSPQVKAARDFGDQFDKEMVIIVHIDGKGQLGYASYGKTKALCSHARSLADMAFDAIMKAFRG